MNKSLFSLITLLFLLMVVSGCSHPWKQADGSCVYESEEPPLRRVVNYADPKLCQRGLPPKADVPKPLRTAPLIEQVQQ